MCYSHANVFYGLFVRAVDLVHAGLAWKELEPVYLALDMISAKRKSGQLSVEGAARIQDVSQEVWEMVKQEPVAYQLAMAGYRLAVDVQCRRCEEYDREVPYDFRKLDRERCWNGIVTLGGLRGIFASKNEVSGHSPRICILFTEFLGRQDVDGLLTAYGLYQPSSRFVVVDEPYWIDEDASSAIAFAPPSSRNLLPTASPESSEETHGHEIEPFDPSIFSLPPNAANRIRSFCRIFRLEVVDVDVKATAKPPAQSGTTMKQVIEPRWQLWATSEYCP